MKLLLVIVSIIAVFTVDCRDFPDGYEDLDSVGEAHRLPGEHDSPADGPKQINAEEESNLKETSLSDAQGPQEHESSESDQQLEIPALTKTIIQDFSIEEEEEQQEHSLRRLGCKARNACVVMGGFCVTNASLCGGRLVPEGCKGISCQCCVPGTLETKIRDIEQDLNSMKDNLTDANTRLSMDLQTLKDNLTDANSNHNMELQSMKDNLTDANLNLNMEFQSMKDNLTDANSKLSMELKTLKDSITDSFSNIGTKLDSIMRRCPVGFFHTAGSSQCYRFYNDTQRSWTEAKEKCQTEGLVLAEPSNPLSLRIYLVETYGQNTWVHAFVGARGTGSYFRWERSRQQISNSDSLWKSGHPGSSVSTSNCLLMLVSKSYLSSDPNQPYYAHTCSSTYYTVCEYV